MKIRTHLLIAVSAIALAASPAAAGHGKDGEKDHGKHFEAMDADGNGSLTLDEVTAYYEKKEKDTDGLDEKFAKVDGDENGEISREEWDAHIAKKKEEKKKEGGEE